MTLTPQCLCYLFRTGPAGQRQVLLGMKLQGFGTGKVMGLGGHVEAGETAAEAAVREVFEECGARVDPAGLSERATIVFRFPTRPKWDAVVTAFFAERWTGEPADSAEITSVWHDVDALPLDRMWDDERYWLPRVLAGERLTAEITYATDCTTVAHADVNADLDWPASTTAIP